MSADFRCAVSSLARDEPLAGTASTFRAFLLVECAGPWGTDALQDCRIPDEVTSRLVQRCAANKVRPLLIRRHGRPSGEPGHRVFVAHAGRRPWTQTVRVTDSESLLDLDLERLGAGTPLDLATYDAPLFLVCTHGKHDVCCAERGRPVAAALARSFPEHTWEVSHIGGDRFAGNLLVLPDGLYYGRLDGADAVDLAHRQLRGEVDLDHLRGRSSYPFAVQAAEIHLRRELGCLRHDELTLVAQRRTGDDTTARFEHARGLWTVRIRSTLSPPDQLTCRALRDSPAPRHELLSIDPG